MASETSPKSWVGISLFLMVMVTAAGAETTSLDANYAAPSLVINPNDIFITNGYDVNIGTGGITIKSGGILDASSGVGGDSLIRLEGDWSNSGMFAGGSSTLDFDGAGSQIITPGASEPNYTFNNITISGPDVTLAGFVQLSGNFVFEKTTSTFSTGGHDVNVAGDWINNGTFNHDGSTVTFNGLAPQIIITGGTDPNKAFNNVGVTGAGVQLELFGQTLAGDFVFESTGTSKTNSQDVNIAGNLTINSGTLDANASNLYIGGNWTNNGTFDAGTSTVTLTGDSNSTIAGTNATTFHYLKLEKADGNNRLSIITDGCGSSNKTWVDSGTLDFSNADVTFTCVNDMELSGTGLASGLKLDLADMLILQGDFAFRSASSEDITGGTIKLAGSLSVDPGADFTPTGGVVVLDGSSNQTINSSGTFYGLTIDKSGGSLQITDGTTATVDGAFNIAGTTPTITGTSTAGYGLTLNGDINVPGANINYANPVEIGGSGSVTFNNVSFGNFIDSAASKFLYITRISLTETFDGCSFGPGPNGTDRYNVHVDAAGTTIEFTNWSGAGGGEDNDWDYDDDPSTEGHITWVYFKHWVGSVSSVWSDGNNWSPSGVPDSTTDVCIPAGSPYDPLLDVPGYCLDINVLPGGTLNGGLGQTLNVSGDWTNSGTFTAGTGTVKFTGGSNSTITGTNATTFHNLRVEKTDVNDRVFITTNGCTCSNRLWVDSGALDFSNADVTFSCSNDVEFSQGGFSSRLSMDEGDELVCGGNLTLNSGTSENITGGTIRLSGSFFAGFGDDEFTPDSGAKLQVDGLLNSVISIVEPSSYFADLTIEKTGGASVAAGTNISVKGSVTINSGVLDANGHDISVAGDWTNNDTFNPDSSKVTLNGTSTINSGGTGAGKAFYNVELNGTSATLSTNAIDIDGDFTITSGTWNTGGFGMYVAGNWTNNGTFGHDNGTVTFDGTGTVGGAAVDTFYNLNVADSGQTTTLTKNITVDRDFTIGDGTYNGAFTTTLTWHLDYPIVVSAGAAITNGTIELAPSADFDGFGSYISSNLNNLKVNSPTYTVTMTDDVNCDGNLDVTAGTLNTGSGCDLDIGGNITIGGTLTAADPQSYIYCQGNWTNNGTFNPGSGTVTFTGSGSLISGGTSAGPFHNLTVSSGTRNVTTNSVKVNGQFTINSGAAFQIATGGLNLHSGQSVDLDGTLSLDPSSGSGGIYWYVMEGSLVDLDSGGILTLDGFDDSNRVYLRSSADGNPWYLNDNTSSGNNPFIDYVDVKDSDASPGNIIDASSGTNIDSGNNPNWLFTPVIFVDATAPAPGPGDGTSWYDAYKYLQDALAEANSVPKPVEVWVAEQTYTPDTNFVNPGGSGDRQATFQLISDVAIYGGFPSGGGSWAQRNLQAHPTILSGDLDSNDVQGLHPFDLLDHPSRAKNSYHVIAAFNVYSVVLEGFHIIGGNANGLWPDCNGGGLYSVDSNITVANCSFFECSASSKGGAMFTLDNHPLEVRVLETTPKSFCPFSRNTAAYGGAIYNCNSSSSITNCTFGYNIADVNGGGMYNKDSNSVVTGCSFIGNSAVLGDGGGIYNEDSNTVVTGCTFIGNSAVLNGGAMIVEGLGSITKLANCTFSGNDANTGGGIAKIGPSPPTYLTNCILWGNTAYYGSKQAQQIVLGPGTYINYSCVEGWTGGFGGTGNIGDDPNNDDPDFVREPNDGGDGWGVGDNDDYGDLHLVPGWPGSACINTGDPCDANYIGQVDIDGDPRVSDGRVDMGSDEVIWDGATGISPDANIILNPGGGPNDLITEALVLFDNNSAGDANIIVVEMSRPVYPSEGYFEVLGTTLRIDTTLSDGEFSAIVVIPFDSNDLAGADPCKLNLMYYDAVSKAWKLAVAGNTGADPIGTRWLELAPSDSPPTWETLESRSLGDYGTYWEPSTSKGIVWAYVDHFTDFSAAGHGIPDFEPDGDVDMVDFAFFAEWWQESACGICGGVELTGDGSVDFDDLRELADNWLAGK